MSREGNFLIYCTEQYKNAKNLTGKQVSELFTRFRVWDYIYSCFEALHTTGANYIVEDIDLYIEARQNGVNLTAPSSKRHPPVQSEKSPFSASIWDASAILPRSSRRSCSSSPVCAAGNTVSNAA